MSQDLKGKIVVALQELQHEQHTFSEVWGVKGSGKEHTSTFWSPFTGPVNQVAVELYEKSKRLFEKMGATPEVLREILGYIAKARDGRPVDDKTHSQEEEDRRIAERRKEHDALDAKQREMAEAGNRMRAKAPRWAQKAIVAELREDRSDPMTDYFASATVRRMLLGWRSGKREDFRQLHDAASKHPETAHLNAREHEHRERWAWGEGLYLGTSKYRGWLVRSVPMSELDKHEFEDCTPAPAAVRQYDGIEVKENEERNGVEIIFPWKPNSATRDQLKKHGFRWSRHQALWYATRTDERLNFARGLRMLPEAEVKEA